MGEYTAIPWCHHTFNGWRGCTKVSAGCENCYAWADSKRFPAQRGIWGPKGTRVIASEDMWKRPHAWHRSAVAAGERRRVFCASLADVFEGEDTMPPDFWDAVEDARARLFQLILDTPQLDWLLLTKRPENVLPTLARFGPSDGLLGTPMALPPSVWTGTSVENQAVAGKRIQEILRIPAAVHYLSMEPLLEAVDIRPWLGLWDDSGDLRPGVDWVIIGGESGPHARPCDLAWIRSIRDQCRAAGVPVFVKQVGKRAFVDVEHYGRERLAKAASWVYGESPSHRWHFAGKDSHGGDPAEWPEDLRVREFPMARAEPRT